MTSAPPDARDRSPQRHGTRSLTVIALALALLALALFLYISGRRDVPQRLAAATSAPGAPIRRGGAWYWLERPKGAPARLMRVAASRVEVLATAEALPEFDADGTFVAWLARERAAWSVQCRRASGGEAQTLWSGPETSFGVCVAGERVFWMRSRPAVVADGGPLPPLAPSIEIYSAPCGGGTPALAAVLPEPGDGRVLGLHGNTLYAVAYRRVSVGITALYRIPFPGGPPRRVAGEKGLQSALLARNGALYWRAPSREAVNEMSASSLYRLGRDDTPEKLSEWLPAGGTLVETERGVAYVDGSYRPALWPAERGNALPHPFPTPEGYTVVAASDDEMLLQPLAPQPAGTTLYRMPLR